MSLTTGRIAIDDDGNIYQLGAIATAPASGLTVALVTATPAAQAAAPSVSLGEPQDVPDGTQLPAGIWEIQGSVYAGSGGATIRQVVFGDG